MGNSGDIDIDDEIKPIHEKKNSFLLLFTSKSLTFFILIFLLESIIFLFSRPSRHAQRAQSTQCEQLGVEPHMESVLRNLKKVSENQRRQPQVSSDNRALSFVKRKSTLSVGKESKVKF